MKNNLNATKGNLVLLKCWDSKTPEETSPTMFDFFQACITNKHTCVTLIFHTAVHHICENTYCVWTEKKPCQIPLTYLKRKINGCYLNTYIFLYKRSRKKAHTINQLLKEKVRQMKSIPQNLSTVTPKAD